MLEGKTIRLRPIMEQDLPFLYAAHVEVANRGPYYPTGVSSESGYRKQYEETGFWGKDSGKLVIEDKQSNIVGHIEYFKTLSYLDELEIAYRLYDEKDWGKDYTSQALTLLVDYLFRHRRENRIRLVIHPENKGSIRVAEKCGFSFEGIARWIWFLNGRSQDAAIYALLRPSELLPEPGATQK